MLTKSNDTLYRRVRRMLTKANVLAWLSAHPEMEIGPDGESLSRSCVIARYLKDECKAKYASVGGSSFAVMSTVPKDTDPYTPAETIKDKDIIRMISFYDNITMDKDQNYVPIKAGEFLAKYEAAYPA